jgi:hypothetical protein
LPINETVVRSHRLGFGVIIRSGVGGGQGGERGLIGGISANLFNRVTFLRNGFAKTSKSFFSFSWNATEPLPLEGANRTKIGTPMAAGF